MVVAATNKRAIIGESFALNKVLHPTCVAWNLPKITEIIAFTEIRMLAL